MLTLGACSSDLPPQVVITGPTNPGESFSEISYKILPPGEEVTLQISEQNPWFRFKQGLSRYEALSLPDMKQPYRVKIESEVVKGSWTKNGRIYYPVLTFLDADKRPISSMDSPPYTLQKSWSRPNYIVVTVEISEELAAARYLVIHTEAEKLNYAIGHDEGSELIKSSGFDTMMFAPLTEPRYRYEFTDEGWLRVLAFDPQQAAAKAKQEY